jgi:hypothetical protein
VNDILDFADWCKGFGNATADHVQTLFSKRPKAPSASAGPSISPPAPWPGFESEINLAADRILYGTSTFCDCDARIVSTEDSVDVQRLSFRWDKATVAVDAQMQRFNEGYEARSTAQVEQLQSSSIFRLCNDVCRSPVGTKYDVVTGAFDSDIQLFSRGMNIDEIMRNLRGNIHVSSVDGVIEPLRQQGAVAKTVVGVAGAALSLLGQSNQMGVLDVITRYFQRIPYDAFEIDLSRGEDFVLRIDRASIANRDIHVFADGFVEVKPSRPPADQALRVATYWNARSEPMASLFACDATRTDELGYFVGPTCVLGGTLADVDTSDFKKLFKLDRPSPPIPIPNVKGTAEHLGNAVKGIFDSIF